MESRVACGKILLETEFSFDPLHRFCYNGHLAMYSRVLYKEIMLIIFG